MVGGEPLIPRVQVPKRGKQKDYRSQLLHCCSDAVANRVDAKPLSNLTAVCGISFPSERK
jgi:hypothetical protein